jgi:hypothetical protein
MKANELRIGNWVNVTDKDYQVTQILERGVNCGHIGAMYDLVKPIPLTEEWLVNHGEGIDFEGDYMFVWRGIVWYYRMSDFSVRRDYKQKNKINWVEIKYVHQLQNLYFALTGEELTIKTIDQ